MPYPLNDLGKTKGKCICSFELFIATLLAEQYQQLNGFLKQWRGLYQFRLQEQNLVLVKLHHSRLSFEM